MRRAIGVAAMAISSAPKKTRMGMIMIDSPRG
jgi:hypothetical protein